PISGSSSSSSRRVTGVPRTTSSCPAMPSAAKEAYAFAVLGFLTVHGIAGTVPACTGARHASVLGSLTPGRHGLRLPEPAAVAPVRMRLSPQGN
ncbi:anhydro-N-acetylmuramic acid kinase, partial [Streptomyces lavendulocolor]|uniref:anhydro-N-acetylmuramic acid kinase n=1 Tax=Streptomyces lavendulocolor TaxID=67316 RepID=UPI0033CE82F8